MFTDYLDQVRLFQEHELLQRRPVRVIVTSRITLIDKAIVPRGTTIVRLEAFDSGAVRPGPGYGTTCNAPTSPQPGSGRSSCLATRSSLELAEQPLLLLMLAIYDSAGNQLSAQPDIDQTRLYDGLLRRFIERELSKGGRARVPALPTPRPAGAVDREMDRLGVAAIGMFNRQDVKIRREELNADLRYFDAEREGLGRTAGRWPRRTCCSAASSSSTSPAAGFSRSSADPATGRRRSSSCTRPSASSWPPTSSSAAPWRRPRRAARSRATQCWRRTRPAAGDPERGLVRRPAPHAAPHPSDVLDMIREWAGTG